MTPDQAARVAAAAAVARARECAARLTGRTEMRTTIWKFTFDVEDAPLVPMPKDAVLLPHVHAEAPDRLTVWAEVNPEAPTEQRRLRVVGTGGPLYAVDAYLGSVVAGPFVWHVYDGPLED